MTTVVKKGYDETLTAPVNHKDSSTITMRTFDGNLRNINSGLMAFNRDITTVKDKMKSLDDVHKHSCELKQHIAVMENTLNVHTKLLTDMFELLNTVLVQRTNTVEAPKESESTVVENVEPNVENTTESEKPTKSNKTNKSTKSTKPTKSTKSNKSTKSTKPTKSTKSAKPVKSVDKVNKSSVIEESKSTQKNDELMPEAEAEEVEVEVEEEVEEEVEVEVEEEVEYMNLNK